MKNSFRGDLYSGVTAVFTSPNDCCYFARLAKEKQIDNCCLIDESDIQFFKILSLYCWVFDDKMQRFIQPDYRMANFGDTAVVVTDFYEFLDRYARALFKVYPKLISMLDRVKVFDFSRTQWLNPLFCKHESQAYQNELRIAFGALEYNPFLVGIKQEEANSMILNYDPVILQLGDLRDITVEMPIDAFMTGYLPEGFKCRWPSNEPPHVPSNFDGVRAWTVEQIKKYRSIHVKPTYTIDGIVHSEQTLPFVEFAKFGIRE